MTTTRAPVEAKTQAAGVAGAVAGALIWILQTYVVKGTLNPGLVVLIYAAVPAVLAFGAAYFAPHTPRPGVVTNVPSYSLPQNAPPVTGATGVTIQAAAPPAVDRPTGGI